MRAYVDTSVLLRVVLGSRARLRTWRRITEPMASEIVRVEALRAIDRARILEPLEAAHVARRRADVLARLESFTLAGLSRRALDGAAAEMPSSVGTLDAIHLATAMALRRRFADLVVATHDEQVAAAAVTLRFRVLA